MRSRPFLPGIKVPEIGLGCWQLGADWGDVSEEKALAILEAAYANGVRLYDTAAGYGGGRSERILGEFAKSHSDMSIITKSGAWRDPNEPEGAAKLRANVESSLENLQTDCLDLLQLHCLPVEVTADDRVWAELDALVGEGKIANYGASVETIEEARKCLDRPGLKSLQIIFNCLRPEAAQGLLDEAKSKQVAIIVRLPLASGLLSGKMKKDQTFADNDHRNYNKDGAAFNVGETFAGLTLNDGIDCVAELDGILSGDAPLAQRSIRWILDHEAVSVIIPGASKVEQVESNVAAAKLHAYSADTHEAIAQWYGEKVKPLVRGLV